MRNLQLLQHKQQHLPFVDPIHMVIDHNSREITYIVTQTHIHKINADLQTNEELYQLEPTDGHIVGIQHLSLNDELCLATEEGEVLMLNLRSLTTESVAFCSGGIDRMSWSPDQEVVVFVTKTGLLVIMDTSYSPIFECSLSDTDFGDGAFVNVGWGHKETQFHGTEGKAAAKQKPLAEMVEPINVNALDKTVSIVWRGDAEYFAVSFVSERGREFKVYDKEGKLQFTSEKSVGLEGVICWRPSGSWIAIPQVLPNKYVIALFEKNGLKHREIVMPFKAVAEGIVKLEWSSDSDVLAIETLKYESHKSCIYLYTMCNYHWYQKQTLEFDCKLKSFLWDARYSEGKQVHVLVENQTYNVYRWDYNVNYSHSHTHQNQALVGVIDGHKLMLTNFRASVIPPPMCSLTLTSEHPINCIDFINVPSDDSPNLVCTIDTTNTLTTYRRSFENGLLKTAEATGKFQLNIDNTPLSANHWLWLTEHIVIFTQVQSTANTELFVCELKDGKINQLDSTVIKGFVSCVTHTNANEIMAISSSGFAYRCTFENGKWLPPKAEPYQFNDIVETACTIPQADGSLNLFALKHKHWLQLNGTQLATDVTSMFLTEKYLLFTTLDKLKFVNIADGRIVNERRMERGGRLVVVVPKSSRTVLQMPRGNLEAIQPRVLSLCIIGDLLDASEYHQTFDLMRKERLNLNLLYDHNPEKFTKELNLFIESISNPHWLNLFLSDLENVDVTATMYNSNYLGNPDRNGIISDKVNIVCHKVRETILASEQSMNLVLPVITSHVKQNNLEEALSIVWNIRKDEINGIAVNTCSQDALKYLLYLVDVNELYNVALGMYDLGLVLFVAAKSQKDPKEYLPFLNDLKKIDNQPYQRYKIDLYLKRYAKALENICKCGKDKSDQALELIVKESLYTMAMRFYYKNNELDCYQMVLHAFAEYLREKGKFRDACLMYERSGDLQQAILSARHILDWQKCISLAKAMQQSEEEINQLVTSLLPALIENGYHQDAAELVVKYQGNYGVAIPILCDGRLYLKALYEARMNADHLIDPVIRPHIESYVHTLTAIFEDDINQFVKNKTRLALIRREKAERKLMNHMDDVTGTDLPDDSDLFSDTSSMNSSRFTQSSRGTGKTHRSSKNRRKHERKLLNLKEGNPFEDIALIDALYNAAHKAFDQQTVVRTLGKALIDQHLDDSGVVLQKVFGSLLKLVRDSLDEIWIPEMIVSGQVVGENGIIDYATVQEEQHYAMIKTHQRFKPVLKAIDWEFDVLI